MLLRCTGTVKRCEAKTGGEGANAWTLTTAQIEVAPLVPPIRVAFFEDAPVEGTVLDVLVDVSAKAGTDGRAFINARYVAPYPVPVSVA